MKVFSKILTILMAMGIFCTLIAGIGSAITKKPVLLTVIRSNSMYPVWERGDLVIIENLKEKESIQPRNIVFFKTKEGSLATKGWIAHRVMSGDNQKGFITKGDANEYTDQESVGTGPINREWIAGRALTIGGSPLVIPKMGYLSLWAEKYQSKPYILPVLAIILACIIAIGEFTAGQKKGKKRHGMELPIMYIIGGVTISVIMGGTMLASGQTVNVVYGVSNQSQGVLMGSDVGMLKVGDEVSRPLSELSNGGFFPLIGTMTTDDLQIGLSDKNMYLSQEQHLNTTFTVHAEKPGLYESVIKVGLFYPLLPSSIIYFLAQKSYWLALVLVSIVPGIPLMIYPLLDGKMRRRTIKFLRKKKRNLIGILP
ncbi:MAG: signal peptidase I [Bacillus sp. (in: Bacteria)]|nr:signal peptidase I [Bacillus sp. (in: firmicutes)]